MCFLRIEMQQSQARWPAMGSIPIIVPGCWPEPFALDPIVRRSVVDLLGAPLTVVEHDYLPPGSILVAVNTDTGQTVRIVNVEP